MSYTNSPSPKKEFLSDNKQPLIFSIEQTITALSRHFSCHLSNQSAYRNHFNKHIPFETPIRQFLIENNRIKKKQQ